MTSENFNIWFFKSFGALGVFLVTLGNVPQIRKMIKTKRTDDISKSCLLLLLIGTILLQIYAGHFRLWEVFIPNNITLLSLLVQLLLKRRYDTKIEPIGILDKEIAILQEAEDNFSQDLGIDDHQLLDNNIQEN